MLQLRCALARCLPRYLGHRQLSLGNFATIDCRADFAATHITATEFKDRLKFNLIARIDRFVCLILLSARMVAIEVTSWTLAPKSSGAIPFSISSHTIQPQPAVWARLR